VIAHEDGSYVKVTMWLGRSNGNIFVRTIR
jgi:hypothetical protein